MKPPGQNNTQPKNVPSGKSVGSPPAGSSQHEQATSAKSPAAAGPIDLSKLVNELKLPEKDREEMLEIAPDQFLPGHESSISRYFQRLIEDEEHE